MRHIYSLPKKGFLMTDNLNIGISAYAQDSRGERRQTLLLSMQTLVSASECGLVSSARPSVVSRFFTVTSTRKTNPMPADKPGSKTFYELLKEAGQLHAIKSH